MRSHCAVVLILALGAFLGGCSISINEEPENEQIDVSNARTQLEQVITDQLPRQVKKSTGIYGYVSNVICASTGDTGFDCVATVESSNGRGYPVTDRIPVSGACDSENCTWRTE